MIKGYPVTVIAVTIASITLCIAAASFGAQAPIDIYAAWPRLPYVMGTPVMVTGECRV